MEDFGISISNSFLTAIFKKIGHPDALCIDDLIRASEDDARAWFRSGRHRSVIRKQLARFGYVPVRNVFANDGLWSVNGRRQVVYVRDDLSVEDRQTAVFEKTGY